MTLTTGQLLGVITEGVSRVEQSWVMWARLDATQRAVLKAQGIYWAQNQDQLDKLLTIVNSTTLREEQEMTSQPKSGANPPSGQAGGDPKQQCMSAGMSAQATQSVAALGIPWATVWTLVQKYGPAVIEEILALLQRHSPATVEAILAGLGLAGKP